MEDLNRRSNGKFFPTIPGDSTGFKAYSLRIGWFERLEQSAVVERLERAAVIGERLNKSLDLPLVQPLFGKIACVRLTDHEFQFFATQCFEECLNASHRLLYLMGRWW